MTKLITVIVDTSGYAATVKRFISNIRLEQDGRVELIWLADKGLAADLPDGARIVSAQTPEKAANKAVSMVQTEYFMIMPASFLPQRGFFELIEPRLDEDCFTAVNISRYHKKMKFAPLYPDNAESLEQLLNIRGSLYSVVFCKQKFCDAGLSIKSFALAEQYRLLIEYRELCGAQKIYPELFLFTEDLTQACLGEISEKTGAYRSAIIKAYKNDRRSASYKLPLVRVYRRGRDMAGRIYSLTFGRVKKLVRKTKKFLGKRAYVRYLVQQGD